jgi:hypothetical protein
MLKEPSSLRRRLAVFTAALAVFVLAPAAAQAASLKVIFPQSVEVTVVQGQSTDFTMELTAQGATPCSATTAPVRVDTLYSLDTVGDTAAGLPADIPIVTEQNRGSSDNCYIKNPTIVPLTVTAAADTPVGDYTTVIRYGKGGDGGVDLDGPPLTIHVIAPDVVVPEAVPLVAPPAIIVLGERVAALRPTLGKTLLLSRVKGKVSVQPPGKAVQTLSGQLIVPNGTVIDATNGVVKVTVERDASGALDSVDAWGGAFKAVQIPPGANPAVTVFTLAGPLSSSSRNGASAARVAKSASKRSLWVNGKGNFKTRGKRASAIVRGTYWYTEDTGSTTKVSVKRGLVAVRDFVMKHTVLVSAGHSYTAKPRTHVARRIPAFTGSLRKQR